MIRWRKSAISTKQIRFMCKDEIESQAGGWIKRIGVIANVSHPVLALKHYVVSNGLVFMRVSFLI